MKYSEAGLGRVFVIRLEDGDILHQEIERFAEEKSISAAALIAVGGADRKSCLVVGPEDGRSDPVSPMEHVLEHVHEAMGAGTVFPDEDGKPLLHMHMASGRRSQTVTGCVRKGVKVWHIMEIILIELTDTGAMRKWDKGLGFKLLNP